MSFFPGRGVAAALSADRRGRLLLHSFSSLLLKTAVASRLVLDGSLGAIASVAHLTPFFAVTPCSPQASATTPTPAATPAAQPTTPGAGGAASSAYSPAATGPAPPGAASAAAAPAAGTSLGPPAARVGDGLVAVCSSSGCHIGRFKPSGELLPLFSIPRPAGLNLQPPGPPRPGGGGGGGGTLLPSAAWLPHQRRTARPPPLVVDPAPGGAAAVCAVLAVGWHDLVMRGRRRR